MTTLRTRHWRIWTLIFILQPSTITDQNYFVDIMIKCTFVIYLMKLIIEALAILIFLQIKTYQIVVDLTFPLKNTTIWHFHKYNLKIVESTELSTSRFKSFVKKITNINIILLKSYIRHAIYFGFILRKHLFQVSAAVYLTQQLKMKRMQLEHIQNYETWQV